MPLLSSASLISTPDRAVRLFPPVKCHQCDGRRSVERLGRRPCEACEASGYIKDTTEPCPECQPTRDAIKGTGVLTFPEKIPCPRCNSSGQTHRVPEVRPTTLGGIKAGDWVRIGVEFPGLPVADTPAGSPFQNATAELISCIVASAAAGRVMARVMKAPDYPESHGLRYGDTLELSGNQILAHTVVSPEEFEKARDGGLLNSKPMSILAPEAGKAYYARNGANCVIWTKRVDASGEYFLGAAEGSTCEWHTDGAARGGRRDFDLVAPKQVVNT